MFSKILVANRGEIACRVIATATRLGVKTVAVYSDADAGARHVGLADEAVHIGGSAPAESYLVHERVIEAAQRTGAEAIHPGYGFLSENAAFSQRCQENGIIFIGPPARAIDIMGSKSAAKQAMEQAGVPLLPGYHGDDQDPALLLEAANAMGYPVLLKAVAGGGGKGMRQVHSAAEFTEALAAAKREALSGFGNDDMLVEKFLEAPRHVEVQVFCDSHSNGVYLFERDCSVQRRHQKIIEEAPAPGLSSELRTAMGEAGLKAAMAVDYVGAGTVEFLLDKSGEFYFMEMNTRLQVEHPVTEMVTGQDLVEWQLRVAAGETLPLSQDQLKLEGHSFEARIYAEDPDNAFLPAAGTLAYLQQPEQSDWVRIDTGVTQGDEVGTFYDPMIAKLIVWDADRDRALQRLAAALADYRVSGVTTNIPFLRKIASHAAFQSAALSTDFIDRHTSTLFAAETIPTEDLLILGCLGILLQPSRLVPTAPDPTSPWHADDNWRMNAPRQHRLSFSASGEEWEVVATVTAAGNYLMRCGDVTRSASGRLDGDVIDAIVDGHQQRIALAIDGTQFTLFTPEHQLNFSLLQPDIGIEEADVTGTGFKAPMHGTIVDILVQPGEQVSAGETILIMEAMKMEHAIKAPVDGKVTEVFFGIGDLVDSGNELVGFEALASEA